MQGAEIVPLALAALANVAPAAQVVIACSDGPALLQLLVLSSSLLIRWQRSHATKIESLNAGG